MRIRMALILGGTLLLVPFTSHAAERLDADVDCRVTEQTLVYDCSILLKGRKCGTPIEGAKIAVGADMPSMPMAHNVKPVDAMPMGGPGMYHARLHLEMHGEWALKLSVESPTRDIVIKKLHFGDMPPMDHAGQHGHGMAGDKSCTVPVTVSAEAERRPGGAIHAGSHGKHHSGKKHSMPGMEGAHMDHKPRHGGAFFMASNMIHHLEGVFSDACGFQLFMYNAFTKPIHVDRFQAMINVVPSHDDEPDVMRFLSPSEDNTVLSAAISDAVTRPFRIDLHVKFPGSDDPQLFTIRVPAAAAAETAAHSHGSHHKAKDTATATVHMISAQGIGHAIGTITVTDGDHGVMVKPDLTGLSPGQHAFHIHQNGDCGSGEKDGKMVAGLKAGAHYGHGAHSDGSHGKPKGDLPELTVVDDGTATKPVMSHHLHAAELAGRSIMIHAASEADGGGARVACGVFPN